MIGSHLSPPYLTSAVVELISSESNWTLDRDHSVLVVGGLVVAVVVGDEVWMGRLGCCGDLLSNITDDNLGILRQTEVSTIVVDATHPSFTGIRQRLTLIDVWKL